MNVKNIVVLFVIIPVNITSYLFKETTGSETKIIHYSCPSDPVCSIKI